MQNIHFDILNKHFHMFGTRPRILKVSFLFQRTTPPVPITVDVKGRAAFVPHELQIFSPLTVKTVDLPLLLAPYLGNDMLFSKQSNNIVRVYGSCSWRYNLHSNHRSHFQFMYDIRKYC